MPRSFLLLGALVAGLLPIPGHAATGGARDPDRVHTEAEADAALKAYFEARTESLARGAFEGLNGLADWQARRADLRRELLDMLGLWPLPPRTDLRATVTGRLEHHGVVVEKLHFQSLPGLYVTANLYRPRNVERPLPAVLYACGHARVVTNGVSCGNKTGYQHHGYWFARHGYVCLLIDTLQLGEIEGVHHGTHRLGQWWWNARGYTPAGVEAWNGIRALDYLESRPDVDRTRLGMTGRSGGGSYTWTTAAVDDRIRVAAPVAGITDLRNQVVDGVVEGHCDCMFFVNSHAWDFGLNAALLAPRPLLLVNTDSDPIFPLSGVQRVHAQLRRVYDWHRAATNLGLVIAPGPHRDTQDLQVPVFRWFNQHLRGEDPLVAEPAIKPFDPLALRALDSPPADQRNTSAQEWFGPPSASAADARPADEALARLRARSFAGWPSAEPPALPRLTGDRFADGLRVRTWAFESEPHVPLELGLVTEGLEARDTLVVRVIDEAAWTAAAEGGHAPWAGLLAARPPGQAVAFLAPRGVGPGAWSGDARKQVQIRRRFMLLGQTLDGMRVWDIRRGLQVLRDLAPSAVRVEVQADGPMAVNALYAALYEPGVHGLRLARLPASHRDGPDYLNVLQVLDVSRALELAREHGLRVILDSPTPGSR